MKHNNSDPVTWGDLRMLFKKLDSRIDECFDTISSGDAAQSEFWSEHEDKLSRQGRAIRRLQKISHTHEAEEP